MARLCYQGDFLYSRNRKSIVNKGLHLSTTKGLVKKVNEDRVGCVEEGKFIRICVADGHWGGGAVHNSKILEQYRQVFQKQERSGQIDRTLTEKLFEKFGQQKMDETKDFTPETSFLVLEVSEGNIKLLSYGDCRLLVCRKGKLSMNWEQNRRGWGRFHILDFEKG